MPLLVWGETHIVWKDKVGFCFKSCTSEIEDSDSKVMFSEDTCLVVRLKELFGCYPQKKAWACQSQIFSALCTRLDIWPEEIDEWDLFNLGTHAGSLEQ